MANPLWGIVFFMLLLFCMGAFVVIMGYRMLGRKRLIENTPTSTIRSIAMGLVELKGKAVAAKETLTAPLSGKKCFRYWWIVEELHHDKDGHEQWRTVKSGSNAVPFHLQDSTGKVLIDCTAGEIDVPTTYNVGSGIGHDPPKEVQAFLDKEGIKWSGWVFNKPMRYRESALVPNTQLYLMGEAMDNPEVSASPEHTENIIVRKGKDKIMYISTRDEKKITRSLAIGGVIAIIFGIVLGLGAFIYMTIMGMSLLLH
jgi:hypothetical protein